MALEIKTRSVWRSWPVRLLIFFFALIAAYIGCQLAIIYLAKHPAIPYRDAAMIAAALLLPWLLIALYSGLVRWLERRNAEELRLARAPFGMIGGAAIGVFLFCTVYGVLAVLGVAHFQGYGTTVGLAFAFSISLLAAFGEELLFRGGIFRILEDRFGTTVGILVSGALFGLLHAANPGATIASSLAIAIEAGILLAAAYAATRSLWVPIGLHFGWNFTEGGIFGAAVSGGATKGLLNVRLVGPDALTGGQFGPEASIAAVAVCFAAAFVLLVMTAQRGQWQAFRLRA